MTKAEIAAHVANMKDLTRCGITDGGTFIPSDDDLLMIVLCMHWIGVQKRTQRPVTRYGSSYTLKHLVEEDVSRYISNGAFIAAARLEGLTESRVSPCSISADVNLSSKRKRLSALEFRGILSLVAEEFPEYTGMNHTGTDQLVLARSKATANLPF